jgi:SpoVK/Ycf46/Vps4 family AAA+-type ATPase
MGKKDGKFKLIKKTNFSDIKEGFELPESDLCFQNEDVIAQFEYVKDDEEDEKYEIKPGMYTLARTSAGVRPKKTEFRNQALLEEIDNTKAIMNEAKTFFSRLHIYEKLGRPMKRGVLLYSSPGMGKTSAIAKFSNNFIKEDSGTVVFNWPTSDIEADDVAKFLSISSEYTKQCTRLILVIEDIGGGERENGGHANQVDSGLLNLLDGVDVTFKLPTFIVATTNHPENLLGALADRPGRFDLMLQLDSPSKEEKIKLTEFIAKRKLDEEEKKAFDNPKIKDFSIAHLEEIIVRSLLHDKTIPQVIEELIQHRERFNRAFEKDKGMGIGFRE